MSASHEDNVASAAMSQGNEPSANAAPRHASATTSHTTQQQQQALDANAQLPSTNMSSFLSQLTPAQVAELRLMLLAGNQPSQSQPSQPNPPTRTQVQTHTHSHREEPEDGEVESASDSPAPAKNSQYQHNTLTIASRKHKLASPPTGEPPLKRQTPTLPMSSLSPDSYSQTSSAIRNGMLKMALMDGVGFDLIANDPLITQRDGLRQIYADFPSSGESEQLSVQSAPVLSNNTSSLPKPSQVTTPVLPSTNRQDYLARLQAAKNKKTEVPKAPVLTSAVYAQKKSLDPKKNELLKQKLAALKAEQAVSRQQTQTGLTSAADPTLQESQDPLFDNPVDISSGRSSALSTSQQQVTAISTTFARPFDINADDYDMQRLVIDVSDEDESELDESDNGVQVSPAAQSNPLIKHTQVSAPRSTSATPKNGTPTISAYEKKLQEIELAKQRIAERERRTLSRPTGLATPLADVQTAFTPISQSSMISGSARGISGTLPGIQTIENVSEAAPSSTHSDAEMDGDVLDDDEGFDDIYENVEAGNGSQPATEAESSTAADLVVAPVVDNVDTEMEDTEDFYDTVGTLAVAAPTQPQPALDQEPGDLTDASMDISESEDESDLDVSAVVAAAAPAATAAAAPAATNTNVVCRTTPTTVEPAGDGALTKSGFVVKSVFTPYESPLTMFKAYRYQRDEYKTQQGDYTSLTYSHKINPYKAVCPIETNGEQCPLRGCQFQHFADMELSSDELMLELAEKGYPRGEHDELPWSIGIKDVRRQCAGMGHAHLAERLISFRQNYRPSSEQSWILYSNTVDRTWCAWHEYSR